MALFTTSRRVLGSILSPIRTWCCNTSRQVRIYKGNRSMKCNAFIRTRRHPAIRFRKGNYRQISQSSSPTGDHCDHPKAFPAMAHQLIDEFRLNGGYIAPLSRYSSCPGIAKRPVEPIIGHWRWYAQAKEPGSPAPSKGGPVTTSGGGVGKLDAANERGFFHKVNKSRLQKIKEMLKDKSMLRGADNQGNTDPK